MPSREGEVYVLGDHLERAHRGQVVGQEAGVGLHHGLDTEDPVDEAVLHRDVGLESIAADLILPEDLAQPFEVVLAIVAVAQDQRDVGIVRPGKVVVHERAGIGIACADPLVVANLMGDWH